MDGFFRFGKAGGSICLTYSIDPIVVLPGSEGMGFFGVWGYCSVGLGRSGSENAPSVWAVLVSNLFGHSLDLFQNRFREDLLARIVQMDRIGIVPKEFRLQSGKVME